MNQLFFLAIIVAENGSKVSNYRCLKA